VDELVYTYVVGLRTPHPDRSPRFRLRLHPCHQRSSCRSDQAVAAVLGTIISGVAVGLSLTLYWQVRRRHQEAEDRSRLVGYVEAMVEGLEGVANVSSAMSSEALDSDIAEAKRQEWIEERLKEEPASEQRMEELNEDNEKEHPS
jgi:hypothetical protein